MPLLRTCILIEAERAAGLKVRTKEGHPINAATLGEAIYVAENLLEIKIVADPNSSFGSTKFFKLCSTDRTSGQPLGIMILRGDIQFYPVNELNMPLMETDVVVISALAGGE